MSTLPSLRGVSSGLITGRIRETNRDDGEVLVDQRRALYDDDVAKVAAYVATQRRRRKTLTLQELQACIGTCDWQRLHESVVPLVEEGLIAPFKSARSNGSSSHPVFEKYRILDEPVPAHDLTLLHPSLVTTTYLERHPQVCHTWWNALTSLSAWIAQGMHERDASLRERCWEVFGDEKAADSRGLASCVRNASGYELRELLVVREDAPEDLPYVIAEGVLRPTSIVVSENRDPYLAIRSQLLCGKRSFLGVPVDAVVCGCGNTVRQAGGSSLRLVLESMRAVEGAHVRYWGDVDREGLTILAALCHAGLIEPFEEAYEAMLDAPRNQPRMSPDGRDLPMPDLDGLFDPVLRARLVAMAADGLLLPQEALSCRAVGEAMR